MAINVLISNPDYITELLSYKQIEGIYVEFERIAPGSLSKIVQLAHGKGKKIYMALPYLWNEAGERALVRELPSLISAYPDGYLIRNLDELGLLRHRNAPGLKIIDAGLYTWNKSAIKQLSDAGADFFTLPYELNSHEIERRGTKGCELVVYGRYPMMISNSCIRVTTDKCQKTKKPYGVYMLEDRTGARFPVVNCCRFCYNITYNSVPTWLLDEPAIASVPNLRFNFTIESKLEMKSVLNRYFSGDTAPIGSITRGHYKRGAQ